MDIVTLKEKGLISQSSTMKFLYNKGQISYRTLTICKENGLKTISDLKNYIGSNYSFKRLKGCGDKTNDELLLIVNLDEERQLELLPTEKGVEVKIFYNKGEISVRGYNICVENNLNTLDDLVIYRNMHGDFYKLNKCGYKTNNELLALINEESSNFNNDNKVYIEDENIFKPRSWYGSLESVNNLGKKDRDSVNGFIQFALSPLSSRSKKYIMDYYDQDLRLRTIISKSRLIDNYSDIKPGSKYFKDINFFYDQVLKNLYLDRDVKSNIVDQFLEVLLYGSEKINRDDLDVNLDKYSGLKIIDILIKEDVVFGERSDIILNSLNIYEDFKERTLEEVGKDFELTRERIRQLRFKGLVRLDEVLKGMRDIFSKEIYSDWDNDNKEILELTSSTIVEPL